MSESEPRFAHDCNRCEFLGRLGVHDVYACPQGFFPTIVMRYGNEGWEYDSGRTLRELLPSGLREKADALFKEWRA